jgi:hypothetical protein
MSQMGQKQKSWPNSGTSALLPITDMQRPLRGVPIIDTKASLTIHGDNEFDWIIGFRAEWDDCATGLQVTPP